MPSAPPTTTAAASCLCGAIRWQIALPIRPAAPPGTPRALLSMSHCHCGFCRKAHGASYATYLGLLAEDFRFTAGTEHITRYESSPGVLRPFCARCGSVVPDDTCWEGRIAIPAGPFDDDLGVTPACHIFAASRAPWVTIDDDLPRFDTFPPGISAQAFDTRPPADPDTGAIRGSCLCGEIAFLVLAPPIRCRTCHCSRCRKAASAAHCSYLVTPLDGVRFTRGEDHRTVYAVPEARYFKHAFCRTCGSSMPRLDAERGIAVVPMGSLDDDPGVRPAAHIFVASRAPWDIITDAAPQYEESPPATA